MKIINSPDLEDKIRVALTSNCSARCLDNEDDFEAVMSTIKSTINGWLENRCAGCK